MRSKDRTKNNSKKSITTVQNKNMLAKNKVKAAQTTDSLWLQVAYACGVRAKGGINIDSKFCGVITMLDNNDFCW